VDEAAHRGKATTGRTLRRPTNSRRIVEIEPCFAFPVVRDCTALHSCGHLDGILTIVTAMSQDSISISML
jgi:hypothetical protein